MAARTHSHPLHRAIFQSAAKTTQIIIQIAMILIKETYRVRHSIK